MKYIFLTLIIPLVSYMNVKQDFLYQENKSFLIVIVKNDSNNPVMISLQKNYQNLNSQEFISTKRLDTLNVPINAYQYIYFSTKNTFKDTLLVSPRDTLKLEITNEKISSYLTSSLNFANSLTKSYRSYYETDSVIKLRNKINLLTASFYSVNFDKPMITSDDFSKSIIYRIRFDKEIYNTKKDEFIKLLLRQYENRLKFYNDQAQNLPVELITLEKYKAQYEIFSRLHFFYVLSPSKDVAQLITSKMFINNNLLENPYCNSILNYYLKENFQRKKLDLSQSKNFIDFKEAYDNIPKYWNHNLTKYARFLCLENMIQFGEPFIETKKKYLEFKKMYKDARLNDLLEEKYLFDLDKFNKITQDLKLITYDRKIVSLSEVIKVSNGKLIYIDFWASWCVPCRVTLPSSLQLQKEFQNKNIVFIYLSIDKDISLWKQASSIEKLDLAKHSYKILNGETSNFLKDIKLKEIPRYLLFNKRGDLVHQNAPDPKGNKIRDLFNKYL